MQPHRERCRLIPPKRDAAFAARMEDLLELYAEPRDSDRPMVCVGEGGKQPIGDVRPPLPVRPGSPAREDNHDRRGGVANLFLAFEPLAGRRFVEVTERKTAVDFARFLKRLCDERYPDAEWIRLICGNLRSHTPAGLYRVFASAEARRRKEPGRDRVERAGPPRSGRPRPRRRRPSPRGRCLAAGPQRRIGGRSLAHHDHRGAH